MAASKSSYDYEELLACARGELFGPDNAQLPYPPMLMFNRITEVHEDGGEFGKGFCDGWHGPLDGQIGEKGAPSYSALTPG